MTLRKTDMPLRPLDRGAPKAIAMTAGVYALIGGTLALVGWALNVTRLTDWDNNGIAMKSNAALCAMAAGLALIAVALAPGRKKLIRAAAALVAFIGGLTLLEHLTGWNFGIDTFLFDELPGAVATTAPNRMGPPASMSFTLIGAALLLVTGGRRARRWAAALGFAVIFIASLSLVGYLYNAGTLYTLPQFTGIALQTASMLALLGVGLVAAVPEEGITAALRRADAGGVALRRLLLPILFLPLVASWLRLRGQQAGLYDVAFGVAVRTLFEIVVLLGVTWWVSRSLSRADELQRQSAIQLGLITDAAPVFIAHCDEKGRFKFVNQAYAKRFDLTPQDCLGKHISEIVGATAYASFRQHVEAVLRGKPVQFEVEIPYAALGKLFMHAAYAPEFDAQGKVAGFVAAITDISERKRAEDARRDADARFATAFNASPLAITLTSLKTGKLVEVNETFVRVTGYSRAEAIGKTTIELGLWQPADRDEELAAVQRAGLIRNAEYKFRMKDGTEIVGLLSAELLELGSEPCALTVIQDITERKRVEEQLRRNHDTFFNLIETAPFGLYVVDAQFRLRQVSAASQKVFSNVSPLLGRDFAEVLRIIWTEPFASEVISRFRHTLETGEPYAAPNTTKQRHDIAEIESYDWKIERITLPDGQFGVVCYFYDITERMQAAELTRRANERFELAESASQGFVYEWIVDERLVERSQGLAAVLGYAPDEVPPAMKWWWEQIHPDDHARLTAEWQRIIESAAERGEAEYRVRHRDGHWVMLRDRARLMRDETGRLVRMVGTSVDITDRKAKEAQIKRLLAEEQAAREAAEYATRAKDEFLAVVSHELRSPLNAMLGWTRMLHAQRQHDPEITNITEIIQRNGRTQIKLIEDLLDTARIISGKLKLETRPLALTEVIAAALDTVRPAAESKRISLETVYDPGLTEFIGQITGDADRLQQVVWNLLTNAVKFTPEGGHVGITLRQHTEGAQIVVSDTGQGIPAELLPYVFDRFRQGDSSSSRRFGGLGLGLALVKHLVELHGGQVQVTSAGTGQGATFIVTLPVRDAAGGVRSEEVTVRPAPPARELLDKMDKNHSARRTPSAALLQGLRVLVVDDDEAARTWVAFTLRQAGAQAMLVDSATAALAALAAEPFDLLLSDIGISGEDGYQLMRHVRAHPDEGVRGMRAIALTGYTRTADRLKALQAGFQTYVGKPVEEEELLAVAASLTGRLTADAQR